MYAEQLVQTAQTAEGSLVGWRIERLKSATHGPLAVVATGGTQTAALLWARLHEAAGSPAWAMTPYEFVERGVPPGTRVLMISVSGRSHDTLHATQHAIARGWPVQGVCCDSSAPLATLLRGTAGPYDVFVLPKPALRDPAVAFHDLVTLCMLAARVYGGAGPWFPWLDAPPAAAVPAICPHQVVTLGAGVAAPAAIDFAFKCAALGLAPAWRTDPRQFAQGDCAALGERVEQTLLVSFATRGQEAYLDRFFAVLPPELPRVRIDTGAEGVAAALTLLAQGLATFERLAGELLERGTRPAWGRALRFVVRQ